MLDKIYTKEYRKGYLAGIKRILELIKHLDEDGCVCDRSSGGVRVYGFIIFQHLVDRIIDLYNGLSESNK